MTFPVVVDPSYGPTVIIQTLKSRLTDRPLSRRVQLQSSLLVSLYMHLLQQIIPCPITSILLPKEKHGRHCSDQRKRHTSPDVKCVLRTHRRSPIVHKVTEPEQDDVLDRHGRNEDLIRHAPVRVQGIVTRADTSKHDSEQHNSVDRRGGVRRRTLRHKVSKQHQPDPRERADKARDQSVLGLVDALVATSAPFDERIR